jgi:hypothetical protein
MYKSVNDQQQNCTIKIVNIQAQKTTFYCAFIGYVAIEASK